MPYVNRPAFFEIALSSDKKPTTLYRTKAGLRYGVTEQTRDDALVQLYMCETPSVTTLWLGGPETVGQS